MDARYVGQNFELAVPLAAQGAGGAAAPAGLGDGLDPAGPSDAVGDDGASAGNVRIPIPSPEDLRERFLRVHESAYGYANPHDSIEIVNVRLTARGRLLEEPDPPEPGEPGPLPEPFEIRSVRFAAGSPTDCPVYERATLTAGHRLEGPAIVEQLDSTTPVFPGDRAAVDTAGNLVIQIGGDAGAGQQVESRSGSETVRD